MSLKFTETGRIMLTKSELLKLLSEKYDVFIPATVEFSIKDDCQTTPVYLDDHLAHFQLVWRKERSA